MTTLLFTHPACIEHEPGPMHPECPARLKAVLAALDAPEFAGLERREAPPAAQEQIARVHPANYVATILEAIPASGHYGNRCRYRRLAGLRPGGTAGRRRRLCGG